MKIKVLKMMTECKDRATGLTGVITHWDLDMDGKIIYLFQPKGVNPKTGQPVEKIYFGLARLEEIPDDAFEEVEVPFEILGTEVEDIASGYKGMAVGFFRHTNGCFHVLVQPRGVLEETNSPIKRADFDIRQLRGEKIPTFTQPELAESKRQKPSPAGDYFEHEFPPTSAMQ